MAWMAMQSHHITGAVAGASFIEGVAVELHASGVHNDLPVALIAASGSRNLFVALVPPDQFPRPTPRGLFSASWYQQLNPRNAEEFLIDTGQRGPYYLVGPSLLTEPTIYSGWLIQCHRGGAYTLTSGNFVDTANIRVIGNRVEWNGTKFTYTTVAANVVGYVREYRDGKLTIVLDHRSA